MNEKNDFIYYQEKDFDLYKGKMEEVLPTFDENSIDCIVCDPPYELNFMNKKWDNTGVAFRKETWEHCFRVLKDGGYLIAFGGTRTYHRIACAIEDAGFEIRDSINWVYGSGFPKSENIGLMIDKRGGDNYSIEFAKDLKNARIKRNLTIKYCDDKYCNGSTNWSWYEGRKDGCRVPDYKTFLEICKEFSEMSKYTHLIKSLDSEVVGTIIRTRGVGIPAMGEDIDRSQFEFEIKKPVSQKGNMWQGFGTCLKPAFEPIIVARKPFKGSLVDNVLKNGVGAINIDECRVETTEINRKGGATTTGNLGWKPSTKTYSDGRFPANIITDGSEEVEKLFPYTKSGNEISYGSIRKKQEDNIYKLGFTQKEFNDSQNAPDNYGDEGSAMRYFKKSSFSDKDLDYPPIYYGSKASKEDRDEGLDDFEDKLFGMSGGNQNAIAKGEFYQVNDGIGLNQTKLRKNDHPTVKPTELMQYLVRMFAPKGSVVLDCFMGSGSCGKACMFENRERNANYHFIGIEMTEEYLPICKARIDYAKYKYEYEEKKEKEKRIEKGTPNLFDLLEE